MRHIILIIALVVAGVAEAKNRKHRDPVQRVDEGTVYAKDRLVENSLPFDQDSERAEFEYKLAMNKIEKSDITCKGDTDEDHSTYTSNASCDDDSKICTVKLKLDAEVRQYKCSINFFGSHEADKLRPIDLGTILIQDGNLVILNKRHSRMDRRLVSFEHTK